MIIREYENLAAIYHGITNAFIHEEEGVLDKAWQPRLFSFRNFIQSKTAEMPFDLASIGLTKARWARFLNAYVDPRDLMVFFEKIRVLRRGAEIGMHSSRKSADDHDWGSCLQGISFMRDPEAHLCIFSRTTSFAQTGAIDLAFAHVIGRYLCQVTGMQLKDLRITWTVSNLFVSVLHAVPYITSSGRHDEVMSLNTHFSKYYKALHSKYFHDDKENRRESLYGPVKRMILRHDQIQNDELKPVPIESLDLSPLLGKRSIIELFRIWAPTEQGGWEKNAPKRQKKAAQAKPANVGAAIEAALAENGDGD